MINGIINIYKEQGFTSHDVTAKLRKITGQKKVGHTGTLDPDATGVLPVCFGKATKVCGMLTDAGKSYEAVMLLGVTTDTEDISGKVLTRADESRVLSLNEETVRDIIMGFVGEYEQTPPMYSAVRVNGKRLYELARRGVEVKRQPRLVHIMNIDIKEINLPRVRFSVECSKGTYIRTLCKDIGEKTGCGACMEKLIRTRVASFKLEDAVTLKEVENLLEKDMLGKEIASVDSMFPGYMKCIVKRKFNVLIYNGNKFCDKHILKFKNNNEEDIEGIHQSSANGKVRVYDEDGNFIGIYEYVGHVYRPVKMFLDIK